MNGDENSRDLMRHWLVPVATKEDADKTARALGQYSPEDITVLYVVEKGEGVPDKTPVEQSEQIAAESFAVFRTVFPQADVHITYARDVVGAIFAVADEIGASAIVYRSRGGHRIKHLLSGDLSLKLVTQNDRPVIALPQFDQSE